MKTEKKKSNASNKRKVGIALIAGLAMSGIIGASAATLNGLNSDQLGADVTDVSSCDTDGVTLDYVTAYDSALGEYEVVSVNVGGVNACCENQDFNLTISNGLSCPRHGHRHRLASPPVHSAWPSMTTSSPSGLRRGPRHLRRRPPRPHSVIN